MPIKVLSDDTINKIAAGEVVERPLNIVKELLENAIDAGAGSIAVEVRDGGVSLIRITDNGAGIAAEEVRTAFLRHATSKITDADDLLRVHTLGFRGEALASIAAVSAVELVTKTRGALMAVRYLIEGGVEQELGEVGAPDGTTIIVRSLFKNVPARRKFLKSTATEAARIQEIVEMEALAHPEIAFKYLQDGRLRLSTLGNGSLRDVIYAVYGREIAANLIEVNRAYGLDPETGAASVSVRGYLGKPVITRSNRNFELCFVNGRYVKNQLVSKALEDGYRAFLMQHKFPFAVLMLDLNPETVDVNVHPQKMEVRFSDGTLIYNSVCDSVSAALGAQELVVDAELPEASGPAGQHVQAGRAEEIADQPFTTRSENLPTQLSARQGQTGTGTPSDNGSAIGDSAGIGNGQPATPVADAAVKNSTVPGANSSAAFVHVEPFETRREELVLAEAGRSYGASAAAFTPPEIPASAAVSSSKSAAAGRSGQAASARTPAGHGGFDLGRFADGTDGGKSEQQTLFAPEFLTEEARLKHRIIGQLFETYWLVEYGDKLYIIDQHAAHEKVMFERLMKKRRREQPVSQYLNPPILLSLTAREAALLERFQDQFASFGYELGHLGGRDYSVTAVPADLPGIGKRELLLEMLDSLTEESGLNTPEAVYDKIASMSCKAAVKGNNRLSMMEADALIGELLGLDNPYACPHGRPTIISMSHYELDKKFKRIV